LKNKYLFLIIVWFIFTQNIVTNFAGTPQTKENGRLRIASCQFPVSDNIAANAQWIVSQMTEAQDQGVNIVHFPECALSGYAGVDHKSLENLNWDELHKETERILANANRLNIWVILGSTHRLTGEHKPHNSLYLINPEGQIVDRYDKKFCTKGDLKHYSPGDHFVIFDINDVKCGLLICYDIRFPELYREHVKAGVKVIFQSFYNARKKEPGIHPIIMPISSQTRAATNYFFMSITNSSAAESWPCHLILPNGLIEKKLELNKPGILISDIDTSKSYYDASKNYRLDAINGKLNSGDVINDPRSQDRTGF
jgi:predicted amidohydrolase